VIEAKARGAGFSSLYKWVDNRADRRDALVILRLSLAAEIAAAAEARK
jgi:hypothetical protein